MPDPGLCVHSVCARGPLTDPYTPVTYAQTQETVLKLLVMRHCVSMCTRIATHIGVVISERRIACAVMHTRCSQQGLYAWMCARDWCRGCVACMLAWYCMCAGISYRCYGEAVVYTLSNAHVSDMEDSTACMEPQPHTHTHTQPCMHRVTTPTEPCMHGVTIHTALQSVCCRKGGQRTDRHHPNAHAGA